VCGHPQPPHEFVKRALPASIPSAPEALQDFGARDVGTVAQPLRDLRRVLLHGRGAPGTARSRSRRHLITACHGKTSEANPIPKSNCQKIGNFCGAGQELAWRVSGQKAILPAHQSLGFRKNLKGVMRTGPRVVSILGLSRGPKHPTQRRGAAELASSHRGRVSGRQQPASPENSGNVSGVSAVNAEDPGAGARPGTLLASPRRDRRRAPGPCMRFPPTSHSRGRAADGS
jgi:hypothetical protein